MQRCGYRFSHADSNVMSSFNGQLNINNYRSFRLIFKTHKLRTHSYTPHHTFIAYYTRFLVLFIYSFDFKPMSKILIGSTCTSLWRVYVPIIHTHENVLPSTRVHPFVVRTSNINNRSEYVFVVEIIKPPLFFHRRNNKRER